MSDFKLIFNREIKKAKGDQMFDNSQVFLIKALLAGIFSILIIPKDLYKKYFVYGLLLGGLAQIILILIIVPVLHLVKYQNMGLYSIYGIESYWTPIAWTFIFTHFFYLLPTKKVLFYPYLTAFAIFGYLLGVMLENYNIFEYIGFWRYVAPFFFAGWFGVGSLIFRKLENLTLE